MTKHLVPPVYTRAAADVAELTRTERRQDGVRITRGAYVSRAVPLTPANMVAAALAVLPEGALASHGTAAVLFGAPVDFAPPMEFALPPDVYRARRRGIRMHVRDLTAADRTLLDGTPLTSGAQTWLDLAAVLPPDELVAVGDSLYRGGHLDVESLSERLARAGGIRGVARARALADATGLVATGESDAVLVDRQRPPDTRTAGTDPRPVGARGRARGSRLSRIAGSDRVRGAAARRPPTVRQGHRPVFVDGRGRLVGSSTGAPSPAPICRGRPRGASAEEPRRELVID